MCDLQVSHFDMHEEYITNYKRAMSTLQHLQAENEVFRNIAQQALKLETGEAYTLEGTFLKGAHHERGSIFYCLWEVQVWCQCLVLVAGFIKRAVNLINAWLKLWY